MDKFIEACSSFLRSGFVIFWDCFHSSTNFEGCFQLAVTLYKGTEKVSQTKTLPVIPFGKRNESFGNHGEVKNYNNIGVKQMFPK